MRQEGELQGCILIDSDSAGGRGGNEDKKRLSGSGQLQKVKGQ